MPTTISPVASGFFQIAYNGATYTRTTPANPTVKEKTGDDDVITGIVFDITSLFGKTITDIRLVSGVNSLVAGTGAESLRVLDAQVTIGDTDESWFFNNHTAPAASQLLASLPDAVGAFTQELLLSALVSLQNSIDGASPTWSLAIAFDSGASSHEEITISVSPTLSVITQEEIDGDGRDLYAVGAPFTWDGTAGSKWALTSGGVGGQAVPTAIDNVFFDANSGASDKTITTSGTITCLNLDTTGFPGTFRLASGSTLENLGDFFIGAVTTFDHDGRLQASGDVEYHASCTLAVAGGGTLYFYGTSGVDQYFRNNGHNFNGEFNPFGGSNIHLTGDVDSDVLTKAVHLYAGYIYSHDFDFTIGGWALYNENEPRGLFMGSSTWEGNGGSLFHGWNLSNPTGITVDAGTSTIIMTHTSASYTKEFSGGGFTYYNLIFSGDASGTGDSADGIDFKINDSNTFNDISCDATGAVVGIAFEAGSTQTVSTLSLSGSVGAELTLRSSSAGVDWHIVKHNGGDLSIDYVIISDCDPLPGTLLYCGTHSTDGGGNSERVIFGQDAPPEITERFPIHIGAAKKKRRQRIRYV